MMNSNCVLGAGKACSWFKISLRKLVEANDPFCVLVAGDACLMFPDLKEAGSWWSNQLELVVLMAPRCVLERRCVHNAKEAVFLPFPGLEESCSCGLNQLELVEVVE
jgi:hypothetical protein